MRYDLITYLVLLVLISGIVSCSSGEKGSDGKKSESRKTETPAVTPESTSENQASIEELEKRFLDNPASYTSASDLVSEYKKQSVPDKAIETWDRFIKSAIGPDVERARIDRAILLVEIGKKEDAYNELLKLAADENGKMRSEACFQLGNLIATGKIEVPEGDKTEIAIDYFKKALDLGQTDPLVYRRLADLEYSKKNLDQAREYLAIYLVVSPNDGESWMDLGNWSKEAGDYTRAREYYKRALENEREEIRKKAERAIREIPQS